MKILQISTYDIRGGAARATYRLHRGLRHMDQDSCMLVKYKETDDDFVSAVAQRQETETDANAFFMEVPIQEQYINAHRTDISNTLFSLPYPGYDISGSPLVQNADIINLHWVSQFQSPVTLKHIFDLGKPVVYTLHDQWAFTGGCHYSSGCEGYQSSCKECPQLADDPFSLPEAILHDKKDLFHNANITIVTPSRWMGRCARESRLFKSLRVEVIANSLETDLYSPLPEDQAKERLEIPHDAVTFLFGAIDGTEKRKGFAELVGAMKFCLKNELFQELLRKDRLRLLCFGSPNDQLKSVGIPVVSLGQLGTDEEIRDAYSAADIFLLPSLEDNLPNTILESMSCGTSVVAFDVGGVSDMVTDGVNGLLVKAFNIEQMGEAIVSLALDVDKRISMGEAGRKRAIRDYAMDIQAGNYLKLYDDLLHQNQPSKPDVTNDAGSAGVMGNSVEIPLAHTRASQETRLGSRFGAVYDNVLFQALKSYAPHAHKQWDTSELDRLKRLKQVERLTRLLESCEIDREARLEQLKICEIDREARLEQLKICEIDRADRLDLINSLTEKLKSKKIGKQLDECLSEIEGLKQQLHHETERVLTAKQRVLTAKQGWQALENTRVVRKARKLGFIKLEKMDFQKNDEDEK
ncbi:MAG: glycosyltransferase [Deltaproteobacteria bacterium]|jgi:glycosyltransferase involved in cell wall biosynthesis|nr:glycosyltransferase [Deltaproteobacteria bacterium]